MCVCCLLHTALNDVDDDDNSSNNSTDDDFFLPTFSLTSWFCFYSFVCSSSSSSFSRLHTHFGWIVLFFFSYVLRIFIDLFCTSTHDFSLISCIHTVSLSVSHCYLFLFLLFNVLQKVDSCVHLMRNTIFKCTLYFYGIGVCVWN